MPSPHPIPRALKVIRGNPGKRRMPDAEPEPTPGMPKPPIWLPKYALPYWEEIGAELLAMNVMTRADGQALASLACLTHAYAKQAAEERIDPRLATEMRSHWTMFGLSPSARVKVKTTEPAKKESNVSRFLRAV